MQVVSSAQSIQLLNFPDLSTVSKYGEGKYGAYDFQFMRSSTLFICSLPGQPIEYLTKRTRNDNEEIQFVRRIRTDIANTVGCPNINGLDFAIGTSQGHIQLHHYKTMEEQQKFSPPTLNDSVVALDFNSDDEYLASLHESGIVQVFGLKTSVRVDTISFDKETSHIRFHPKRKLNLGMVSYNGSVHIYDTQAKKKIFSHLAHKSPCRDLAMSPVNDNCLVSVGYDHMINLFDTRTKIASVQLNTSHPLSACAISPCGHFCCVGNLKGQLLAFDFRKLKVPLMQTKDIHSSYIKRVEFVPKTDFNRKCSLEPNELNLDGRTNPDRRRDSLQHFFNHHHAIAEQQQQNRRLSNLLNNGTNSPLRISIGTDFGRLLREDEVIPSTADSSSSSDVEFVSCIPGPTPFQLKNTRTVNVPSEGITIKKETAKIITPKEDLCNPPMAELKNNNSFWGSKMGPDGYRLSTVPAMVPVIPEQPEFERESKEERTTLKTSTPLNQGASPVTTTVLIPASKKLVIPDKDLGDGDSVEIVNAKEDGEGTSSREWEKRMNERIELLEKQLQFQVETSTWDLKNYNMIMYLKQMEAVEELQRTVNDLTVGMNCLLQSEDFVQEFFKLRLENEELKARLMGNGH